MALPAETKSKLLPMLLESRYEPLQHFAKEKPGWKLAALFLCVSPRLAAVAVATWFGLNHWIK